MNKTPPIAFFNISFVFCAVWPIYCPTSSSRVTDTTWPRRTKPSLWRILAIRSATVVLPVPGLPVNDMCNVGVSEDKFMRLRIRSISNSDAISRMRVLTGRSPTSSRSSCVRVSTMPTASSSSRRLTLPVTGGASKSICKSSTGFVRASGKAPPPLSQRRSSASGGAAARRGELIVGRGPDGSYSAVASPLRAVDSIGFRGVADVAAGHFVPFKAEARLLLWPVDDERQPHRLPAMAGVESRHPDVAVAVNLAALGQFHHHAGSVAKIKHRQAPHLPEIIAGMRIVGELDVHRPTLLQAILDLARDLLVGEIGQEGETALGDTHDLELLTSRRWAWGHSRACRWIRN